MRLPRAARCRLPPNRMQDEDKPVSADLVAHPPEIETYVVPVYPPEARAKKIQGRVMLMVIVDTSGKVEDDIEVVDSIPMLDQAAIDAVHQWSFHACARRWWQSGAGVAGGARPVHAEVRSISD